MANTRTPVARRATDEQATPPEAAEATMPPADASKSETETAMPADLGPMVEVRVLRDHLEYQANTVAVVPENQIDASWADADPDAVAYVRSVEG